MDVSESESRSKAVENITQFLKTRGDESVHMVGDKLRNTIGFAVGLQPSTPETEEELKQALSGDYCFYKGKSYEAIEVVRKQIYKYTPNSVRVCVLPIEFYSRRKLYELPLFRVINKKNYYRYIDNCGRHYFNFDDFLENNKVKVFSYSII